MSRLALLWATTGLLALGCPLLVDDQLEIVRGEDAAPFDQAAAGAGTAGAPPEPAERGGSSNEGSSGGSEAGGVATACGVAALPGTDVACPSLCDRCEAGTCIFECASQADCEDRVLTCPLGLGCRVECSAQAACNKAVISCPPEFDCELECAQQDSCKEVTFVCSNANCNVRCLADKACEKARVMCGSAQCGAECLGSMHAPVFDCAAACACNPC